MKKQFFKTALTTMAIVGVLSGSAFAAPITGGISMFGGFLPVGTAPPTIEGALAVDFTAGGINNDVDNTFGLQTKTGSFVTLTSDIGVIKNLTIDPKALPSMPFWTIDNFSFDMNSYEVVKRVSHGSNIVEIFGTGMLHDTTVGPNHLEDTIGYWNFTGQGVDDDNFSWSASAGAGIPGSPVPEPATMLLFGSGMLGLAFAGRKIRK